MTYLFNINSSNADHFSQKSDTDNKACCIYTCFYKTYDAYDGRILQIWLPRFHRLIRCRHIRVSNVFICVIILAHNNYFTIITIDSLEKPSV